MPRSPLKPEPTKEQLAAIASGEAALAECTHINVRPLWIDEGPDRACPLCLSRTPHTSQTHYAIMGAKVRRLPRGHPSKIRLAERAYRKATGGGREPMEKTLWREVVTNKRTCRELAPVFGVCFKTVANWCRRIGIQDPEGEGAPRPNEVNEFEDSVGR